MLILEIELNCMTIDTVSNLMGNWDVLHPYSMPLSLDIRNDWWLDDMSNPVDKEYCSLGMRQKDHTNQVLEH